MISQERWIYSLIILLKKHAFVPSRRFLNFSIVTNNIFEQQTKEDTLTQTLIQLKRSIFLIMKRFFVVNGIMDDCKSKVLLKNCLRKKVTRITGAENLSSVSYFHEADVA